MRNRILLLIAAITFVVGCSTRRGPRVDMATPVETTAEKGPSDLSVGTEWGAAPHLEPAYFDTDRAELTESARQVLKRNGAILKVLIKEVPGLEVQVEGHCDERATLEYNMALGQRRANVVKDYYAALGVRKAALSTISYGEERPTCTQTDESCWQLNRRGVTVLRAKTPIKVPLNKLPQ